MRINNLLLATVFVVLQLLFFLTGTEATKDVKENAFAAINRGRIATSVNDGGYNLMDKVKSAAESIFAAAHAAPTVPLDAKVEGFSAIEDLPCEDDYKHRENELKLKTQDQPVQPAAAPVVQTHIYSDSNKNETRGYEQKVVQGVTDRSTEKPSDIHDDISNVHAADNNPTESVKSEENILNLTEISATSKEICGEADLSTKKENLAEINQNEKNESKAPVVAPPSSTNNEMLTKVNNTLKKGENEPVIESESAVSENKEGPVLSLNDAQQINKLNASQNISVVKTAAQVAAVKTDQEMNSAQDLTMQSSNSPTESLKKSTPEVNNNTEYAQNQYSISTKNKASNEIDKIVVNETAPAVVRGESSKLTKDNEAVNSTRVSSTAKHLQISEESKSASLTNNINEPKRENISESVKASEPTRMATKKPKSESPREFERKETLGLLTAENAAACGDAVRRFSSIAENLARISTSEPLSLSQSTSGANLKYINKIAQRSFLLPDGSLKGNAQTCLKFVVAYAKLLDGEFSAVVAAALERLTIKESKLAEQNSKYNELKEAYEELSKELKKFKSSSIPSVAPTASKASETPPIRTPIRYTVKMNRPVQERFNATAVRELGILATKLACYSATHLYSRTVDVVYLLAEHTARTLNLRVDTYQKEITILACCGAVVGFMILCTLSLFMLTLRLCFCRRPRKAARSNIINQKQSVKRTEESIKEEILSKEGSKVSSARGADYIPDPPVGQQGGAADSPLALDKVGSPSQGKGPTRSPVPFPPPPPVNFSQQGQMSAKVDAKPEPQQLHSREYHSSLEKSTESNAIHSPEGNEKGDIHSTSTRPLSQPRNSEDAHGMQPTPPPPAPGYQQRLRSQNHHDAESDHSSPPPPPPPSSTSAGRTDSSSSPTQLYGMPLPPTTRPNNNYGSAETSAAVPPPPPSGPYGNLDYAQSAETKPFFFTDTPSTYRERSPLRRLDPLPPPFRGPAGPNMRRRTSHSENQWRMDGSAAPKYKNYSVFD